MKKRKIDRNDTISQEFEELKEDLPQLIKSIIEDKLNIPLTYDQEKEIQNSIYEYFLVLNKKYDN